MNTVDETVIEESAFPARKNVPGQAESRTRYAAFQDVAEGYPWYEVYVQLRLDGWDWRKAVFIAWASMPRRYKQPETINQLAEDVLGVADRTVRKWRQDDPNIDETIGKYQAQPLIEYRADVFDALAQVASRNTEKAHSDRKLFLEMTGDYNPKATPVQLMPERDETEEHDDSPDQSAEILRILAECGAGPTAASPVAEAEADPVHTP
jgi:hypothetical protein